MTLRPRDLRWAIILGVAVVASIGLAMAFDWWWGLVPVVVATGFFVLRRSPE